MAEDRVDPWVSRPRAVGAQRGTSTVEVDVDAVLTHPAVVALSVQRQAEVRLVAMTIRSGLRFLSIEQLDPAQVARAANARVRGPRDPRGALSRTTVARHMAFLQTHGLIPGVAVAAERGGGQVRSTALVVRLHPGERDRWHAAAQAAGQAQTATWVREVVEAAVVAQSATATSSAAKKSAEKSAKKPLGDQVPPALLTALARIGINLNQLVRRVNTDARAGREPSVLATEVARLRAEFVQLRTELTHPEGASR